LLSIGGSGLSNLVFNSTSDCIIWFNALFIVSKRVFWNYHLIELFNLRILFGFTLIDNTVGVV